MMINDPVMKLRVNTRNMMSVHDAKNNYPVASAMHAALANFYKTGAPLPLCADANMLSMHEMEHTLSADLEKYLRDLESGL